MDVTTILDKVVSHAAALGVFDQINIHEVTNAPGQGYTAAIWVDQVQPVNSSGLDSTSIRLTLMVRIYTTVQVSPLDVVEPGLLQITDTLMAAYTGDFELGGTVRSVDLLGTSGPGLEARAGYVKMEADGILSRVMTITLPLIVNDVWSQES